MKIAIIGSGSTYTPELIEGLIANQHRLGIKKLVLMDIDPRKGSIVGDFAMRMVHHSGADFQVEFTTDLEEALVDSSYVLAQIRVGGLEVRILDETIPLQYGLIGQETTGIGGFFKALRTAPVLLGIARQMERLCPDAWLINFSNPSGILAEMILHKTSIRCMGLCNVPINMMIDLREKMELPHAEISYLGLNHLSWVTSIRDQGVELLDEAIAREITAYTMKNITQSTFDYDIVRTIRAIPSSYLEYFYFHREKLAVMQTEEQSRGQLCKELEGELLALYSDETLVQKPEILSRRGGHRYSQAAVDLICSIHGDLREQHVVNIKNSGTIPFMEGEDVVEIAAIIGANGAEPVPIVGWDNPHIRTMMRSVKEYERLTWQAALAGDHDMALTALLCHPLLGDFAPVKDCYYAMQEANRSHLPLFQQKVGRPHRSES